MMKVPFQITDRKVCSINHVVISGKLSHRAQAYTLLCKMAILNSILSSQEMLTPSAPRQEVFMNHVPNFTVANAVCTHGSCPVVSVKVMGLLRIPRIEFI